MKTYVIHAWVPMWRSKNKLDGVRESPSFEDAKIGLSMPPRFYSKSQCEKWIQEKYGYIKERKDLRREPHGWRMPKAMRMSITFKLVGRKPKEGKP